MSGAFTKLLVHVVWATRGRQPLLRGDVETMVRRMIVAKCRELRCVPLAIGNDDDHVHLAARLAASVAVAQLVKLAKGSTSRLVNGRLGSGRPFRWQPVYGAFTFRESELPVVLRYVLGQRRIHALRRGLMDEWECTSVEDLASTSCDP